MCTKEQVKEALTEILYDHDEDGMSIVGREVNAHITNKGNQIVTKLTIRFGLAIVGTFLTAAAAWYALYYQVQENTKSIEINKVSINEGGRFTQEDADARQADYFRQILELKQADIELKKSMAEDNSILRSDIKDLRNLILSR